MAVRKRNDKNWYLLIRGRESGPFDYNQVLLKIGSGEVSSFDFIKALNQEDWGAVADHELFNSGTVSAEMQNFTDMDIPDHSKADRRHPRSPILADVFVKKEGVLVKGRAIEIGKGGMGIEADESLGDDESVISIYCSPISESIAFNCHAKIVSKVQLTKNKYRYGIQFIRVSPKGEIFLYKILDAIKDFKGGFMMRNLSLLVIGVMFTLGCSNQTFQTTNDDDTFAAKAIYNEDVDVLWVVDNSFTTMEVHQNRIANKMNAFYDGLIANGANFRVAATTMDMAAGREQGDLVGTVPVVTKDTPNAVAHLQNLLKRGGSGSNGERGLDAMRRALEKQVAMGDSANFLRADAQLVVVFVTDDEDFSAPSDPATKIKIFRDYLNGLKGDENKWSVNYIGVTDLNDPNCTTYGNYSARGEEYIALSYLSDGVIESICESDFGSYVDQVTVRLKSVGSRYKLKENALLDSLTVYKNGVLIREDSVNGWVYDAADNVVILNGTSKPGPDDEIKIEYEIRKL